MSVYLILLIVFVGVTLIGHTVLVSGVSAVEEKSETLVTATDSQLRHMFLFANTRRLLVFYIAAITGVPLALWMLDQSPVVILVGLALVLLFPQWMLARLAARRRAAISAALPDALAQIAGAMRAGSTFGSAVQSTVEEQRGPLGQELGLMLREQRVGARLEEALDNLGERVQSEEMDLVISAALISQEVGGNLAEILQRLSETIRRKMDMEGKIKALTSQGVLQGYVVTALPFLIMTALLFMEAEAMRPIFSGLLGWIFLFIITVLVTIGGVLIRKIVSIDI